MFYNMDFKEFSLYSSLNFNITVMLSILIKYSISIILHKSICGKKCDFFK